MKKPKSISAWHWLADNGLMRNGVKPRKVETFDGVLRLCHAGLHASRDILDALQYAPGAILCRVRCSGTITECKDKLVCSRREIIRQVDAKSTLIEFARLCALRAARIHAANACEMVGLNEHADVLRALPDSATPSQIEAALRAVWNAQDAARDAQTAARAAERAAERDVEHRCQSVLLIKMVRRLERSVLSS